MFHVDLFTICFNMDWVIPAASDIREGLIKAETDVHIQLRLDGKTFGVPLLWQPHRWLTLKKARLAQISRPLLVFWLWVAVHVFRHQVRLFSGTAVEKTWTQAFALPRVLP